jgi:hypothetical protein
MQAESFAALLALLKLLVLSLQGLVFPVVMGHPNLPPGPPFYFFPLCRVFFVGGGWVVDDREGQSS